MDFSKGKLVDISNDPNNLEYTVGRNSFNRYNTNLGALNNLTVLSRYFDIEKGKKMNWKAEEIIFLVLGIISLTVALIGIISGIINIINGGYADNVGLGVIMLMMPIICFLTLCYLNMF